MPQAVADVPLLLSLPLEAMKYVWSAVNVVDAAGVGVGVESGVAVGVACGDEAGVGVIVGVPLGEPVGVVVACAVAVGAGVGVGPGRGGVLVPPLHEASSSPQASQAILNVGALIFGRITYPSSPGLPRCHAAARRNSDSSHAPGGPRKLFAR